MNPSPEEVLLQLALAKPTAKRRSAGTAKVWEAASGREMLTLNGHGDGVWSVAFSPDGQRLVTGGVDRTARVWEAATPQQVAAWQTEEQAAERHLAPLRVALAERRAAAEAVAYIGSESPRAGLMLLAGSNDSARIYLNEREICRQLVPRVFRQDSDEVSGVALKAGVNILVFKVGNEGGAWAGSVRLLDAAGQPVQGIKVTLDPEERK